MQKEKKRPNILFIMTDQFRADVLGCAGSSVKTPNLDALASEGVRFEECYTVSPLCVPARISMMTGLYPHTTGAWNNAEYILAPEANLWVKAIRDAGYATSVFGKLHLHADFGDFTQQEDLVHGYGFETVNEVSGPHSTCQTRTHMSKEWEEKGVWEDFCKDMLAREKRPYASPSPLSAEDYYDSYVGRKACEYLESYSEERPWFCHVSFPGPHEPWDAPKPYDSLYNPSDMPSPIGITSDENADRPRGEYDNLMKKTHIHCNEEQAKEIRANYYGNVTLIDEQIGKLIQIIKDRGEWDNTIVLMTSDHGEMNGDHGFINKRNFFRSAMNVPLIVRLPERAGGKGAVSDALVNLMDVGPTLAELAGAELSYEQFGKSVCPCLKDPEKEHRDWILSEYACETMIYDKNWKLAINRQGETYMLFDEKNDPSEIKNLAGVEDYKEVNTELRDQMLKLVMENNRLSPTLLQIAKENEKESFRRSVALEKRR